MFEGIMDKELFAEILDKTLVPYLHNYETHRFMQDNDPIISSKIGKPLWDYLAVN